MYLHQLIDRERSVVVVHTPTGVIKLLSNSGAVFNRIPLTADDVDDTIAHAHAIMFDDGWALASPEVAAATMARWTGERQARWRDARQAAKVAEFARHYSKQNNCVAPGTHVKPLRDRSHLRLVSLNEKKQQL